MPTTSLKTNVLDRFLRYVQIDTQSDPESKTFPSTSKQLVLLDQLAAELKELGLSDVSRDHNGYVFGTVPATSRKRVPVIGFIAHVDTAPDASGTGVKPIVHRDYRGGDIVLPDDTSIVLRPADIPALRTRIGHDIVTASGTTLLGADDKAGVAEIVATAEYLMAHRDIPHGPLRIGFTPDEEVGGGATHFDVNRFGAQFAYTVDGEEVGQLDVETFSADSMSITFQGFVTHPGFAKGRMINSMKIAGEFLSRLPRDRMSPETTENREGFVHPVAMDATTDHTTVRLIVRDFVTAGLGEKERFVESLAREVVAGWPGAAVKCKVSESYRNFKEILDLQPEIAENAREAMRRARLTPVDGAIRGGTDGSRLSFMGLPCPNLFTGGHNYHSRLEWVSVQDMEKAVEVIVNICRVWEEKA